MKKSIIILISLFFPLLVGAAGGPNSNNYTVSTTGFFHQSDYSIGYYGGSQCAYYIVKCTGSDFVADCGTSAYATGGFVCTSSLDLETLAGSDGNGYYYVQVDQQASPPIFLNYFPVIRSGASDWSKLDTSVLSISTPSSGSTQTLDSTTLTVTWDSANLDLYNTILLQFIQHDTQKTTKTISHTISTTSGSFSITLSDLDFLQNGNWDAFLYFYDSDSFLVNTYYLNYQSVGQLSGNYASSYFLTINFSSLPSAPVSLTETCSDVIIAGVNWGNYFDIPCQFHNAVAWLFSDSPEDIKPLLLQVQSDTLKMWPIGYIARFISILSDTTEVEPPPISYTPGSSIASTGITGTYTFQVFDHVTTINSVVDDVHGKSIWDIFMPYWNVVVYLSLFIVILTTLMNAHIGHVFDSIHSGQGDKKKGSFSSDDSYKYKEWLYTHRQ